MTLAPTPIVDAHAHVWSADIRAYPWAPHDRVALPASPAPIESLLDALGTVGGCRAVCLQPRVYGYDHAYLNQVLADHTGHVAGVCIVNPIRPSAPNELQDLVRQHGYRGLRLNPMADPDPDWLSGPSGRPLWEAAGALGLVVSLLIDPHQLGLVASLARDFSDTPILIDHLGRCTPTTPSADVRALLQLADFSNVSLKVSALSTLSAQPYPYLNLHALVGDCYRAYGPQRLLWGTDFPHILADGPYRTAFDALASAMPFIDSSHLPAIMGGNAARLYGLN